MSTLNLRSILPAPGTRKAVPPKPVTPEPAAALRPRITTVNMYVTNDLEMFTFNPLNRPIDPVLLADLLAAIQAKNLLHEHPIIVDNRFVVIDGQHRLTVARQLRLPIYFILSDKMTIEDAAETNRVTKPWTTANHMDHYCKLGLPDYIALRRFMKAHPWLTLGTATRLCFYGSNEDATAKSASPGMAKRDLHTAFITGTYLANDIPFATMVCSMVEDFSRYYSRYKHTPFINAIRNLASNADYDHKRMMQKLEWQSTKLVSCTSMAEYIALLDQIYNFKVKESSRVQLRKLTPNSGKYRVDRQRHPKSLRASQPDTAYLPDPLPDDDLDDE